MSKEQKKYNRFYFPLIFSQLFLISTAFAEIPEPVNIVYGAITLDGVPITAANTEIVVEARLIDSTTNIASYQMGENAEAGDNFVLQIPVDAVGEQAPNTVRIGDTLQIYVSQVPIENQIVTIIDRGTPIPLNLALSSGVFSTVDTDGDGIPNIFENLYPFLDANNPLDAALDQDGDGLSNLDEFLNNTNPSVADTDGDGMSDGFEVTHGLNPNNIADATTDQDNDGLSNLEEYQYGTNPNLADTDQDEIPDGYEVANGFDPINNTDANLDTDNDGYTNLEEFIAGTDPQSYNDHPIWSDYNLTLNLSSDDNDEIGVMFRYQGPDNYYQFNWNTGTNIRRLIKVNNGEFTVLAEDNISYTVGQSYQLNIVANGNLLEVYIDSAPIFSVTDLDFSVGGIALYSAGNAGSHFDDITMSDINSTHTASETFIDPLSINKFTIIDQGDLDGPSSWSVTSGRLSQSSNIRSIALASNFLYGTFAVYDLRDRDNDTIPDETDAFPDDPLYSFDLDSDGMPDAWETLYGLNPNDATDAHLDGDGDGYSNLLEYQNLTDPTVIDTPATQQSLGLVAGFSSLSVVDSQAKVSPTSLMTTSAQSAEITAWDLTTGAEDASASIDTGVNNGINAVHSDGLEMIVGTGDASVQVWDIDTKNKRFEFNSMYGSVLAVHMTSNYYIAGTTEGEVFIWYKDGRLAYSWMANRKFISDIKIQNNLVYITASQPVETSIWDLQGNLGYQLTGDNVCCYYPEFDILNDNLLMTGVEQRRYVSVLKGITAGQPNGYSTQFLSSHQGTVTSLGLNAEQQQMISGDSAGYIYIWDIEFMRLLRIFKAHDAPVKSVSMTSSLAVSTGADGSLKMWALEK